MKHIKYLWLGIITIITTTACTKSGFLDKKVETTDETKVFADSALALQLLTDCYFYTGQDVRPDRFGPTTTAIVTTALAGDYGCLEDYTTMSQSGYIEPWATYQSGSGSAENHPFNGYWSTYYKRIRTLNLFLQNIDKTPISAESKARYKGEARFIRAFMYASLVRMYGGVQLMGDAVLGLNDELVSKRNTYKESVDYILAECDTVAANAQIPNASSQAGDQYGRVTKGMAQALKARMLLTAASPLFNGQSISTGAAIQPLIAYSASYDASLWQKAADAFNVVIQSNQYSLVVDNATQPGWGFRQQFLVRRNTENIFPYMLAANTTIEASRFPRSRSGSGTIPASQPTHNAVQLFGMANGKSITDAASNYNPANPYAGRDPRFEYSIIYNQALIWRSGSATLQPVNSYEGGEDAVGSTGNVKTGYHSRKMADDRVPVSTSKNRVYPIIRYAEILLGYAEALNELGQTENAVTQLKLIRSRAGIVAGTDGRYGIAAGITKDELRRLIQNEYLTELYQEGFYFYNCRRWKTAQQTENVPKQAIIATRTGTAPNFVYTYATRDIFATNFTNRMYLAPIPQIEINKSAVMVQNPGW